MLQAEDIRFPEYIGCIADAPASRTSESSTEFVRLTTFEEILRVRRYREALTYDAFVIPCTSNYRELMRV